MRRVFVGNLSYNTGNQQLRMAFEVYGNVTDARIIIDRDTGKSRGFGFVEFETDAQAAEAIQMADGLLVDGRTVSVHEAKERNNLQRI
jgi:cold-inducible RNA-binding protein